MALLEQNEYLVEIAEHVEDREALFELRILVFVVEQGVPLEEELDSHDVLATHFFVRHPASIEVVSRGIVGAARLVDKKEGVGKVGRVAIHQDHRGKGAGALLMRGVERFARSQGYVELMLEAQIAAEGFYSKLGYVGEGELFLDCDIVHRLM